MDQFLLENVEQYGKLVKNFKPAPLKGKSGPKIESNPDLIIASRLRPMLDDEKAAGLVPGAFSRPGGLGQIDLHELRKTVRGTPGLTSSNYALDRVYDSGKQTEDLYGDLVKPLVPWAWSGGVSTMFAYGQTGSGKTFTVSGLQRLVSQNLFTEDLPGRRNVFVSIVELAGQAAFDLLNSRKPVSILEDSFGSTHLAGAAEYHVTDAHILHGHIDKAASLRQTAPTLKNDSSSRSHAICKIRLENPDLPEAEDGLFYLIDLAGSEAARDVGAHSTDRMKETKEINMSLSVLKDCIRGRAKLDTEGEGKKMYVPFRQSSLTKVLKHVFDPEAGRTCKTVVMACVNPSFVDLGATKNTLRFAEMLRVPVPKPGPVKYDAQKPSTWSNEQLREWITSNSGSPAISAEILAPKETGRQLVRLPLAEFLTRCLKTSGVTSEQATAFQAKFWRLHADSRSAPKSGEVSVAEKQTGQDGLSSRDSRPEMAGISFLDRLRAGMVVSWNPPDAMKGFHRLPGRNLAVLLSKEHVPQSGATTDQGYRCAVIAPGVMPGAFEVYLWQQVVVPTETMEAEVLLEYDPATRYYYETL